jgi:hypothetical protein
MIRTRLVGLVAAVAAAALTVPTLAPAADAASSPDVPTITAVAGIYPHFAGGSALESPIDKVYGPAKKCGKTKRIKGATGTSASYTTAAYDSPTGAAPGLTVIAYRLSSPAKAKGLLASSAAQAKKCPGGGIAVPGIKDTKVEKFKTKLGDTSSGYTVAVTTDDGGSYISNVILARKGKTIVTTLVSSVDGQTPDVGTSVKAAQLALKTAS